MSIHSVRLFIGKMVLTAVALSGFLVFAGAPAAQAQEFGPRAVRYDNFREREAIEHHGYYSRQAQYWRHERREALEHGWRDRYGRWHR